MAGFQSCARERGNEGLTSKDTTQLLNAQTHKPKSGYHAQRKEVRLDGIVSMRLMSRRDCRIATAITWPGPRRAASRTRVTPAEPLGPEHLTSTKHEVATTKIQSNNRLKSKVYWTSRASLNFPAPWNLYHIHELIPVLGPTS